MPTKLLYNYGALKKQLQGAIIQLQSAKQPLLQPVIKKNISVSKQFNYKHPNPLINHEIHFILTSSSNPMFVLNQKIKSIIIFSNLIMPAAMQ